MSGGLLPGGNSAASVYNLQDLTGNTPLQLAAVDAFFRQMPSWRMWQLMNVRYVVENQDIAGEGLPLVLAENELKIFEMGDPFPRAWFVSQIETILDDGQAIARLGDDGFDLHRSAIVVDPLATPLSEVSTSTVTLVDLGPTRLKAEVEASGTHLLVFSQIHYPGWQAKLDGQSIPLMRVNVIQQGVVVPAGQHTIALSFVPACFWWGRIISMMGILIGVGIMLWGQIKKPHH